jgi:hypothetical protein
MSEMTRLKKFVISLRICLVQAFGVPPGDDRGLSIFDLLRYRRHDHAALLCAFELIEVDGKDLRSAPGDHQPA